jgi:hypothetical protein
MTASTTAILTVKVMGVPKAGGASDVSRFVRYVEHRDVHPDSPGVRDVEDLLAYVRHRDRTSSRGRMFDADGPATGEHRRRVVDHVARSNAEVQSRQTPSRTTLRAAYRLILSPEEARGLDLQRLTRATMNRLQKDAGGELPPWVAGEHRNTEHPHVHIVLAARRETAPGKFRTLLITRERLAAMKEALHQEIALQREAHLDLASTALPAGEAERKSRLQTQSPPSSPSPTASTPSVASPVEILAWTGRDREPVPRFDPGFAVASAAGRLSRYHRREAERLAKRRRQQHDDEELDARGRRRQG